MRVAYLPRELGLPLPESGADVGGGGAGRDAAAALPLYQRRRRQLAGRRHGGRADLKWTEKWSNTTNTPVLFSLTL